MSQLHTRSLAAMARLQLRARPWSTCPRALQSSSRLRPASQLGCVVAVRFYANDVQPGGGPPKPPSQPQQQPRGGRVERSFAQDLQGSIQARIRRESQRREQYERWRAVTAPGRNWSITFGESGPGGGGFARWGLVVWG